MSIFTFYCGCEQWYVSVIRWFLEALGIVSTALLFYIIRENKKNHSPLTNRLSSNGYEVNRTHEETSKGGKQ